MKNYKIAIIGLGKRSVGLYKALKHRDYVDIVSVCDVYPDRCEDMAKRITDDGRHRPLTYTDYKKCLDETKPDIAVISTAWLYHLEICIYAMERGIIAASEVGGAYSIESLWELIRCHERTKTPVTLLENACYHRIKLLALNMKRKGCFGEMVHFEGAYRHDLREEVCLGWQNRHYRIDQYIHRNSDNYPTHDIGPIAKMLDINCGNRFLSLVSIGSKSAGLAEYAKAHNVKELDGVKFMQSDIVTTIIKCQNGETVTLTLDTSLPRYYARGFIAQGTKGMISEDVGAVYLDCDNETEKMWHEMAGNLDVYYGKYEHPLWVDYHPGKGGHGGIDVLQFDDLFHALDCGEDMPIDVYDMATWMAISVLSEESMATGNAVPFPDFTNGRWIYRKNKFAL